MDARPTPDDGALTTRELEILRLIAQGLENKEIAERLSIAPKTVGTHVHHILRKLHTRNRVEAVMCAARLGLIDNV